VINNAELNEHEIKHGSLSSDSSVDLSGKIDLLLSLNGNSLLLFNLVGSLLGDLKRFNKSGIL
jgi:hypothetical protein